MGLRLQYLPIFLFSACFLELHPSLAYTASPSSTTAKNAPPILIIPQITVSKKSDITINDNHTAFPSAMYSVSDNSNVATKSILTSNIKYATAQNLTSMLHAQMGLQVNDMYGDGSRTSLNLRGFGDNAISNTLLLIDGMPWFNPDIGNMNLNLIPIIEIEKIEILLSSDSVLYGDQAVGGIVNIITKKAQPKQRTIQISYGSFNSRQIDTTISDVFANGIGYSLGAQHYDANGYRHHNKEQNNNLNLLLSYSNTDQTIDGYIRYIKFNQRLQLPGGLTKEQADTNPSQAEDNIAFSNEDNDYWQAQLNKTLSKTGTLKLRASLMRTTEDSAIQINNAPWFFTQQRTTINFMPEISWLFNVAKFTLKPTAGIFLQHGEYKITDSDNSTEQETAIYGEIKTYLTNTISTIIGARVAHADCDLSKGKFNDKNNFENNATATNLALNYDITKNLRLFVKRATSYRFPKVDEEAWTLNHQLLKTQTGVSYESGLNYKNSVIAALLEIYRLNLNHEIISIADKNSAYFVFNENLDPTKRYGVLTDITWQLNKWLELNGGANYVIAKFDSGPYQGKDMPFVARNTFHVTATFKWREHWRFSLEDIYTGNRYPLNDVENRLPPITSVSVYNCYLNYEMKHYSISWHIDNITNARYYNYVTTSYTGNSTKYYPATGISTGISITIKL